tara:strand:- start:279 stop:842 length:564 start_codon:yes stop_codon:yes gene_type:complete
MSGTQINDLVQNTQQQGSNEDSVVDSIINELNDSTVQKTSQHKMEQLSDEEREILLRQKAQQQKLQQQKLQQQKIQQQERLYHQQQIKKQQEQIELLKNQQKKQEEEKLKGYDVLNKVKDYFIQFKDPIILLVLVVLFNLEVFSEPLKLKGFSLFYDITQEKPKFPSLLLKGVLIAIIFGLIQYFMK